MGKRSRGEPYWGEQHRHANDAAQEETTEH
jgi:hypothetical protein